jgi:hypothetical protein
VPRKSGFLHVVGHSLGGGKSGENRLKISTRRRYVGERNRQFVQWLFYPAWLVPFTTSLNLFVLTAEAIVLSTVGRKASLISDIYIKLQRDAYSIIRIVKSAKRVPMQSEEISLYAFFITFTLVPQQLRLLLSVGLPNT